MRAPLPNAVQRAARRDELRESRARKRAYNKSLPVPSEIGNAWKMLTKEQREAVEQMRGASTSHIACSLALTRSAVHSYIRFLNRTEVL